MHTPVRIFWFRRDLRLDDNAGLYHALSGDEPVVPVFIFDTDILDRLPRRDARVTFIHAALTNLDRAMREVGSSLRVYHGRPSEVWQQIVREYAVKEVFANRDYEPYALHRDEAVSRLLEAQGIPMHTFKDHVVFEKNEVTKDDGGPYTVFTPYSKKWRARLLEGIATSSTPEQSQHLQAYPSESRLDRMLKMPPAAMISLQDMGFEPADTPFPPAEASRSLIRNYEQTRNFPGVRGTSRLGVHFRFGVVSVREKVRRALSLSDTYVNELIWRDFYSQILYHFPHVATRAFRPQYDRVPWRDAPEDFARWCEGMTGYPMVDAGMRELNATGFMHNRARMLTASFLTKHLLIDWRLGEAYFAEKLLDFDLASNNGGWQWAAGCGTDAAPYFRIFNPNEQQKKFDKDLSYVKQWIPELGTAQYPDPMVDHAMARQRCLEAFRSALT